MLHIKSMWHLVYKIDSDSPHSSFKTRIQDEDLFEPRPGPNRRGVHLHDEAFW